MSTFSRSEFQVLLSGTFLLRKRLLSGRLHQAERHTDTHSTYYTYRQYLLLPEGVLLVLEVLQQVGGAVLAAELRHALGRLHRLLARVHEDHHLCCLKRDSGEVGIEFLVRYGWKTNYSKRVVLVL